MGHQPSDSHPVGSVKAPQPSRGSGLPGKAFPQREPLSQGQVGDSRGKQEHSRRWPAGAANRTPSRSLASPVEHVAIPASVSREQGRHFYSGDEAAS